MEKEMTLGNVKDLMASRIIGQSTAQAAKKCQTRQDMKHWETALRFRAQTECLQEL